MKRGLIVLVWVVCGVFNWGASMAHCAWGARHRWTNRDNVGISTIVAAGGPAGTVAILLVTNFCQHGWSLWPEEATRP